MKTSTVRASITFHGRLCSRSDRSCSTPPVCSFAGTMRSRVVAKVIRKKSVPTTANTVITRSNPCTRSPSPRISTSGNSRTWMMNCAIITATKR
ncbi:hypothetical protein D3C71_1209330 [compost metagenome]